MKWVVEKINYKPKGYVLVLAMVGMVTLSFFLITGIGTSTTTMKVSGNYTKTVDSFNYAEVGLAKARPIVESTNFNVLLANYPAMGLNLIDSTPFNDGAYEVEIYDNDDGDGNLFADSDDIIVVRSTGTNSVGGTVQIEAYLQKPVATTPITLPANPSSGPGAALMCGTSTDVKTTGASATISGKDYSVPSFGCSGPACDGTEVGPGGYAVIGESTINASGSGFDSYEATPTNSNVVDSNCDEWETLRDSLASLDTSHPDVVLLDGASFNAADSNDCTDPKVYIINTSETTYRISGNSTLCGVVVVASNTSIEATGNVIIAGLVLVMGEGNDLTFVASSGTPRIFGQVIVESVSVDSAKELEVKGTASVTYSTEGIGYGEQAINDALSDPGGGGGSGLITMAWKETY